VLHQASPTCPWCVCVNCSLPQANLEKLQAEIRAATFAAVSAAEQQSAALKRLIDQSRVDTSKTQEMLEQVCVGGRGCVGFMLPRTARG
jgi:predicted DsbA family dithiol-disulfide isomerase